MKDKDRIILYLSVAVAFLAGVVVTMLLKGNESGIPGLAYGESAANGIIVTTGRIDENRDRLYLVDTEKKVICVYDNFLGKFRLCGIRSYRYDVEFNDSANDRVIEDSKSGADYSYMKKKFEETGGR